MRASRGLKWENKMYKPKRSIAQIATRTGLNICNKTTKTFEKLTKRIYKTITKCIAYSFSRVYSESTLC